MNNTAVTVSATDAHNTAHDDRDVRRTGSMTLRTTRRSPKHPNVLPGFGLSLGYALMYLGLTSCCRCRRHKRHS